MSRDAGEEGGLSDPRPVVAGVRCGGGADRWVRDSTPPSAPERERTRAQASPGQVSSVGRGHLEEFPSFPSRGGIQPGTAGMLCWGKGCKRRFQK